MSEDADRREYTKATVYLPDFQLERFLEFCEKELEQMPELSRVPADDLNGYKEFFEVLAAEEDDRLGPDVGDQRLN
jgi:hypothetical protein